MASRNFDNKQSLERAIKSLYVKATYTPTEAAVILPFTTPATITKVAKNSLYNGHTYRTVIAAAAANPTLTVLAAFTGSAAATVLTITPNSGANNETAQATGSLAATTPITLTKASGGSANNARTFTLQILAAAANPTSTVLAAFTGTAAAITLTITPNDGTNNSATPVNLTTAQVRELIATGAVSGKTITLTDASSLRALQTAAGGGSAVVVDAGEGDGLVCTFAGGVNTAVSLTTAEIVELINDGTVSGKSVTLTDGSSLRALVTAAGGGSESVVHAGEGDLAAKAFAGAIDFTLNNRAGIQAVELSAVGTIKISLQDKFVALRSISPMLIDSTVRDFTFQVKDYDVNPASGYGYVNLYTNTAGSATTIPENAAIMVGIDLKNTTVI